MANDDESNDCINACSPTCYDKSECQAYLAQFVDIFDDKIVINDSIAFLRTSYFTDILGELEGYNGFFPRTLLPNIKLYKKPDSGIQYEDFVV